MPEACVIRCQHNLCQRFQRVHFSLPSADEHVKCRFCETPQALRAFVHPTSREPLRSYDVAWLDQQTEGLKKLAMHGRPGAAREKAREAQERAKAADKEGKKAEAELEALASNWGSDKRRAQEAASEWRIKAHTAREESDQWLAEEARVVQRTAEVIAIERARKATKDDQNGGLALQLDMVFAGSTSDTARSQRRRYTTAVPTALQTDDTLILRWRGGTRALYCRVQGGVGQDAPETPERFWICSTADVVLEELREGDTLELKYHVQPHTHLPPPKPLSLLVLDIDHSGRLLRPGH